MNTTNTNLTRIEDIATNALDYVVVEVSRDTKKPKKINAKDFTVKIIEEYNTDNPVAVPTLQDVTDSGATTTSTINIGDTSAVYLSLGDSNVQGFDDSGIQTWLINNGTGAATFTDATVNTITNANGEIKPYKSYTVRIGATGINPPSVQRIHENNFGDLVWSRNATGSYTGTLVGAFTEELSFWCSWSLQPMNVGTEAFMFLDRNTADEVNIFIYGIDGVTSVDGFLADIEIRVYNI